MEVDASATLHIVLKMLDGRCLHRRLRASDMTPHIVQAVDAPDSFHHFSLWGTDGEGSLLFVEQEAN